MSVPNVPSDAGEHTSPTACRHPDQTRRAQSSITKCHTHRHIDGREDGNGSEAGSGSHNDSEPNRISTADAINFDADSTFVETATKFSIPCVATITSEKPLAANIIKEIQPIIAIPLLIVSVKLRIFKAARNHHNQQPYKALLLQEN